VLPHQEFVGRFLREERYLAAYLLSATGDIHEAEDLLQNVARILWEKLEDYDESRPFGAWATGVAHLEVLKWRQRMARLRETLSEDSLRLLSETAAEHAAEVNDQYYFLADCLQALGATARAVLEMKYAQDRKIRDIAGCLQKSTASIEMILVRSRRTLRECIQRKASQAQRQAP
jgi:RNA polymerase sigma-70 factor (ECF subfamily)